VADAGRVRDVVDRVAVAAAIVRAVPADRAAISAAAIVIVAAVAAAARRSSPRA